MKYKLFKKDKRYKGGRAYIILEITAIGVSEIKLTSHVGSASVFDEEDRITQQYLSEYVKCSPKFKFTQFLQPPYFFGNQITNR